MSMKKELGEGENRRNYARRNEQLTSQKRTEKEARSEAIDELLKPLKV